MDRTTLISDFRALLELEGVTVTAGGNSHSALRSIGEYELRSYAITFTFVADDVVLAAGNDITWNGDSYRIITTSLDPQQVGLSCHCAGVIEY